MRSVHYKEILDMGKGGPMWRGTELYLGRLERGDDMLLFSLAQRKKRMILLCIERLLF
jgi:hypothetical protein